MGVPMSDSRFASLGQLPSVLVVCPPAARLLDVPLLLLLRSTAQQDDELNSIAAEVDPIPGSPVDAPFQNTGTHGLHIAKIAFRHPPERFSDFPRCVSVQMLEPVLERLPSLSILINQELQLTYR